MCWLKSCPRCRGDLVAAEDIHQRYIICLQCGHELNAAEETLLLGTAQPAVQHEPVSVQPFPFLKSPSNGLRQAQAERDWDTSVRS